MIINGVLEVQSNLQVDTNSLLQGTLTTLGLYTANGSILVPRGSYIEIDGTLNFKSVNFSDYSQSDNSQPFYMVKQDTTSSFSILQLYIGNNGTSTPITTPSSGTISYFAISTTNNGIQHLFGSDGSYVASGNVTINGNQTVNGTLTIQGNSTLSNLTLTNETITNNLVVDNNTTTNTLNTQSNATVNGNLTVNGSSTLASLTVTGNSSLDGNTILGNSGTSTVKTFHNTLDDSNGNAIISGTLKAGNTTVSNLTNTGNETISGTLSAGSTTLDSLLVIGTLTSNGNTLLGNVSGSTVKTYYNTLDNGTGNASIAGTFTSIGNTLLGVVAGSTVKTFHNTLDDGNGNASILGALSAANTTVAGLTVNGNESVTGTLSAGNTTLSGLTINGNENVVGTLTSDGNTLLGNAAGSTVKTFHNTIDDGTGNASITGNETITGTLSAGSTTLNSLNVIGNITTTQVTVANNPTSSMQVATKSYVDSNVTNLNTTVSNITLQQVYNQTPADTNGAAGITLTNKDFRIYDSANQTIYFDVNYSTGTVTITGDLVVSGASSVINSTVTDEDHLLLSPASASTIALQINPDTTLTTNAVQVAVSNNGPSVFTIGANGTTTISALSVTGNETISGTLTTNGNTLLGNASGSTVKTFHNTIDDGTGNASILGTLSAANTTVTGLTVNGNETITGTLSAGNTTINGNESITGTLTSNGNTLLGNTSSSTVKTYHNTLDSGTGNAIITGTLSAGATTVSGLTNTGNESITGTLSAGATTLSSLTVTGNESILGNLTVSSGITGSILTASQPNITSLGTLTGLSISGNETITGTLSAGATTLSSLTVTGNTLLANSSGSTVKTFHNTLDDGNGNASINANVTITGTLTVPTANINTLNLNGNLNGSFAITPAYCNWETYGVGAGGASIYNDSNNYKCLMIIGNTSNGGSSRQVGIWDYLTVNGGQTITGVLTVNGGITTNNSNINVGTGTITAGTINATNVTFSGTTFSSLTVNGNGTISGTLSAGATTLNSLTVTNNSSLNTVSANSITSSQFTGPLNVPDFQLISFGYTASTSVASDNTDWIYFQRNNIAHDVSMLQLVIGDNGSGSTIPTPTGGANGNTDYFCIISSSVPGSGSNAGVGIHHLWGTDGTYVAGGNISSLTGISAPSISGTTLTLSSNAIINGSLSTGSTTVSSLTDTGNATINGSLSAGSTTITGLTVNGNESVSGTLNAGATTLSSLSVTGNETITGNVTVGNGINGTILTASQPNITSLGTLTGLSISGNETITGTLSAGATTLSSLTVTNNSSLNTVSANSITSNQFIGALNIPDFQLISFGNTTSSSGTSDNSDWIYFQRNNIATNVSMLQLMIGDDGSGSTIATPTGGTSGRTDYFSIEAIQGIYHLWGTDGTYVAGGNISSLTGISAPSISGTTLTLSSNATISGTLSAGSTTLSSLSITGNETINGSLSAGSTTLSGLTVNGNESVSGTLNAGSTILSSLTVNGITQLGTSSSSTVKTHHNTLDDGNGNVTILGNLNVSGSSTVINSTVTDEDHLLLSPASASTIALQINPNTTLTNNAVQIAVSNNGPSVFTIGANGTTTITTLTSTGNTLLGNSSTATVKTYHNTIDDGSGNASIAGNLSVTGTITGSLSGNASTASSLQNLVTIATSGDATGSATFNGSSSITIPLTLASSGVTAGVYGSSTNIPQITIDSKGRITSAANVGVFIPSSSISVTGGDITLSGNTGTAITNATLVTTGVTAGSYGSSTNIPQITIDAKGRITSATNVAVSIPSGSINVTGPDFTMSGSTGTAISNAILATTGVTAGTYNNSPTQITPFTVDAKGRITSTGTAITITPSWSSISSKPTTLTGYGITDAAPINNPTFTGTVTIPTLSVTGTETISGNLTVNGNTQLGNSSGDTLKTFYNTLDDGNGNASIYGNLNVAGTISGSLSGNASTASSLQNPVTIATSGDATGSAIFNGSSSITIPLTLTSSGITPGTYGDSSNIPQITFDEKGRAISISTIPVSAPAASSSISVMGPDLTMSGTTGTTITNATLVPTGVTVGTYGGLTQIPQIMVDAKGRITNATNVSTYIDLTNATSDYNLQVGQIAYIAINNISTIDLHTAITEPSSFLNPVIYEIIITIVSGSTSNYDFGMYPNKTTYSSAFTDSYVASSASGGASYTAGGTTSYFYVDTLIGSTDTAPLTTKITATYWGKANYKMIQVYTSDYLGVSIGSSIWKDTTTQWSSLGTIIYGSSISCNGSILIKRVL